MVEIPCHVGIQIEHCYKALLVSELGGPSTVLRRITETCDVSGYIFGIRKTPQGWQVLFQVDTPVWIPIDQIVITEGE